MLRVGKQKTLLKDYVLSNIAHVLSRATVSTTEMQ
jgi:hypothetical protein